MSTKKKFKNEPLSAAMSDKIASILGGIAFLAGAEDPNDIGDSKNRGLILFYLLKEYGLYLFEIDDSDAT